MPKFMDVDTFNAFLDSRPGWIILSSIGADGFPHSVPLGYFRDGDRIYCGVRDGTQKLRNIEANPKVSLVVESGSTMADIKGAMVQGIATRFMPHSSGRLFIQICHNGCFPVFMSSNSHITC